MSNGIETRAITAQVFPATYTSRVDSSVQMPYRRIANLYMHSGQQGEDRMIRPIPPGADYLTVEFGLEQQAAERVMQFFTLGLADINCHLFARYVAGVELTGRQSDYWPHLAPVHDRDELDTVEKLKNGQPGTILLRGTDAGGLIHSLVGLGEDTPESLQVLSVRGEVGLVNYDDMMQFYEELHPEADLTLETTT